MKYYIAIILMMTLHTHIFSQDFSFEDIAGTYEGHLLMDKTAQYKLVIKADKGFVFSVKSGSLWLGIVEGTLTKNKFYRTQADGAGYNFFIKNSEQDYDQLIITLLSEASKKKINVNGVHVLLNKKEGVPFMLNMNRIGGNPTIKAKVENILIKGKTASWGNYEAEFSPSGKEGAFIFDYVYEAFRYKKDGNHYTVKDEKAEKFELIYHYDENTESLRLKSKPTQRLSYFDEKILSNQIQIGTKVSNETDILKAITEMTYNAFKPHFKELSSSPYIAGDGSECDCLIFFKNEVSYIGLIKVYHRQGKGTEIIKNEIHKGTWETGLRSGKFDIQLETARIDAYFKKSKKEGVWKVYHNNGKTLAITYKNGKEVSRKSLKVEQETIIYNYHPFKTTRFRGQYQGDDLMDLLARHKDDIAIKNWINNAIYQFKGSPDIPKSDMIHYIGKGIELTFFKQHLYSIKLYPDYPHSNHLPKQVKFNAPPSSLSHPWEESKNSSRTLWQGDVNLSVYSDYETRTKMVSMMLSQKINPVISGKQLVKSQPSTDNKTINQPKVVEKSQPIQPAKTPEKTVKKNPEQPKPINSPNAKVGIGITYGKGKDSDVYEIFWLSSSSNAYKAGIRRFDNFLKINGISISTKTPNEIKNLLEGQKGTSVQVTVERDGQPIELTVIR